MIAKKGSKAVRRTIADNKEWMSIMTCISATGSYIPNLYIFKRKTKPKIDYIQNCEVGAVMTYQENGYMTAEIFLEWLVHFKNSIPGGISKENKHLLIVDGHSSHVTSEAIQFGIENGLDILTLPSHCSHEMQPLDVAIFHPFKLNLAMAKMQRMRTDLHWAQGATMKKHLVEMSAEALAKALKPTSIKSGFSSTGIFPINKVAMDAKLGVDSVLQTKSIDLQQEYQGDQLQSPIPDIFSQMGIPPVQSPMPNLFPELHLPRFSSSSQLVTDSNPLKSWSKNEEVEDQSDAIIESLSHLSFEYDLGSQRISPIHSTPIISKSDSKDEEEATIDLTREILVDYQGWYCDYMTGEERESITPDIIPPVRIVDTTIPTLVHGLNEACEAPTTIPQRSKDIATLSQILSIPRFVRNKSKRKSIALHCHNRLLTSAAFATEVQKKLNRDLAIEENKKNKARRSKRKRIRKLTQWLKGG